LTLKINNGICTIEFNKIGGIVSYHKKKEFVCPYCARDFNKKRQIKSHLKDTHPDKLQECICTMAQSMVGDGCEYCNPELAEEMKNET
jgi:transposase-like protein